MTMTLDFGNQLTPDFRARIERDADRWSVCCSGILDTIDAAAVVQPRFLELHRAALEAKVPILSLDLRSVEYMNSSGLKALMVWFLAVAGCREGAYRIEVQYDAQSSWQRMSLRPMELLAPSAVKLLPAQPK